MIECWLIKGGSTEEFKLFPDDEINNRLLTTPLEALQFYLGGLSLGLAHRMTPKFSEYVGRICVDMPNGKSQGRLVSVSKT